MKTQYIRVIHTFRYFNISIQPMKMPFQDFCISNFVHFSLSMKLLILFPKIYRYSKFCFVFVQVSSKMKKSQLYFIGRRLQKQLALFIASAQMLTGKPLLMSSESFIIAKIFQYCLVIPFSLCMYNVAQPIVILCSLQKVLKVVLINSPLLSVCRHPSFSP